jgi:hypothetical protein
MMDKNGQMMYKNGHLDLLGRVDEERAHDVGAVRLVPDTERAAKKL